MERAEQSGREEGVIVFIRSDERGLESVLPEGNGGGGLSAKDEIPQGFGP